MSAHGTFGGRPAGLACPECGNLEGFSGWIRVYQRVDLAADGTYEEAFGDDDLDVKRGGLGAKGGEAAVAHDVACGECGHEIGDVRFSGPGPANGAGNGPGEGAAGTVAGGQNG